MHKTLKEITNKLNHMKRKYITQNHEEGEKDMQWG